TATALIQQHSQCGSLLVVALGGAGLLLRWLLGELLILLAAHGPILSTGLRCVRRLSSVRVDRPLNLSVGLTLLLFTFVSRQWLLGSVSARGRDGDGRAELRLGSRHTNFVARAKLAQAYGLTVQGDAGL